MKPLVVIPARGGSKGVPRKNIKELGGKPLIQYTLEAARQVFNDKEICVSTDDQEIKEVVEGLGLDVPFIRPTELATDDAGTYEVLLHAIKYYESTGYYPDVLILLQATSPFRTSIHIMEALKLYDVECDMVVSVKEARSNPYYLLHEEDEQGWLVKSNPGNFTRRQDCPKVWELNGAIYIMEVAKLKNTPPHQMAYVRKYLMDEMSSHDIDSRLDWIVAEALLAYKGK